MDAKPLAPHVIPANPAVTTIRPYNSTANKIRRTVQGEDPGVLADIFAEEINMAVWQRRLPLPVQQAVQQLLIRQPTFKTALTLSPQSARASLNEAFGVSTAKPAANPLSALSHNIAELVDMFCCLFDLKEAGLRLAALNQAMCPRFHVDKLQCRLVSTYQGIATEWIPHDRVNRAYLGVPSGDGLDQNHNDIQRINTGDVALLKGERWEGNENAGLVHRSPKPVSGEYRLLLTLDFIH